MTLKEKSRIANSVMVMEKVIEETPMTVKAAVALVNAWAEVKVSIEAAEVTDGETQPASS